MTPRLQAAIAAIEPLTAIERQQLLAILLDRDPPDLQTQSQQFWDGISLQQHCDRQTPIVDRSEPHSPALWPEGDTADFLNFLQQQRSEAIDRP